MKPLLLDLNVILDVILDRRPGADPASALWAAIEGGHGRGLIPAHGVTTIFYLFEKARGATFAREGVERLLSVFGIAPVNDAVVRRALVLAWPDFGDAVCAAAAETSGCEAIVTRDPELPECVAPRDRSGRSLGLAHVVTAVIPTRLEIVEIVPLVVAVVGVVVLSREW